MTIKSEAVKYLSNLRHFAVSNVSDLGLEARSLNWCGPGECKPQYLGYPEHPALDIAIRNTTISEIQAHVFSERLREISLEKVKINKIRAYAFTNLKNCKKIEIKDSNVTSVEGQAFKKFVTDYLWITNTSIGEIPSRTFAEVEVTEEFKIQKSNFGIIKPLGFILKPNAYSPKPNGLYVEIKDSTFDELEGESFKITTKSKVVITNNYFKKLHQSAFMGFSVIKENRLTLPDLIFNNNTLNELKRETLVFNRTSFNPKVGTIILNQTCTCADIHIWQSNTGYEEDIHCLVKSGRDFFHKTAKSFKASNCDSSSNTWVIIAAVIAALLVIIIIASVGVFFLYRRYKKNKEKEYINRGRNKNGSLGLIVPDGRTYRETELHVIVEKAELLTTEL